MSFSENVNALAARIAQSVKALQTSVAAKADDNVVVKTSGNQSGLSGTKTWTGTHIFNAAPQVAQGTLLNHAARRDDPRFIPAGGIANQVLTKWSTTDYDAVWSTPAAPGGAGLGGWVDCSGMDTAAAINAASAAAPVGSTIWLGDRSTGNELVVEDTLLLRPQQRWLGAGGRSMLTKIRAGATFPAGKPLLAPLGYMTNASDADEPIYVRGIHLDLASKAGSHGLVVYNFWSHFEDIQVENASGVSAHMIHVTDLAFDGLTESTNSHSENTFIRCRFMIATDSATAFFSESNNGISNQDGHLIDCFFASIDGYGTRITRAAGWSIQNCHYYAIGFDAISLDNCYATKVIGNYVEDFGGQDATSPGAPTFGYYNGITLNSVLNTRASVVMGNTISLAQEDSALGNRFTALYARAGSGQLKANVIIDGNTIVWAPSADSWAGGEAGPANKRSYGVKLGETDDTGRMLYVRWGANQIDEGNRTWFQVVSDVGAVTVTLNQDIPSELMASPDGVATLGPDGNLLASQMPLILGESFSSTGVTGTLSIDALVSSIRNFTCTGNVTVSVPTNGAQRQVLRLAFLASGAARTITFAAGIRISSGLTRGAHSVPSGQIMLATLEYSTLISAWVLTAYTISAT